MNADDEPREATTGDGTQPDRTVDPIAARIEAMPDRAHLDRLLYEHQLRAVPAFTHDALPHSLAVKEFWLRLRQSRVPLEFEDVTFSVMSQNGEDGILLYILSVIGMRTRRCVEVGCDVSNSSIGMPECSTGNLILNFAFDGLILEKDEGNAAAIRYFFARALTTKHFHQPATPSGAAGPFSPRVENAEVGLDTINELIAGAGFTGEVDVFSQDFDGPDVEAWRRLEAIDPRVVVVEINNRLPFTEPVHGTWSTSTAPVESLEYQASGGSSLAAACEVAHEKGYVFVGLDTTLLNAFFVRRDEWVRDEWVPEALPERRPGDYVDHRFSVLHRIGS